jgi:hypothetical protein
LEFIQQMKQEYRKKKLIKINKNKNKKKL